MSANPSVYAPSGTSLNQNILASGYFLKNVSPLVAEMFPQYHLIDTVKRTFGIPAAEQQGNRVVNFPKMGNTYPAATITGRSLVGGVLTLTWQDPNSTPFRVDDVIQAESETQALCITSIPGQNTFVFQSALLESQTAFTSDDFASGEVTTYIGNVPSVSSGKIGTIRRQTEPINEYNYIPLFQDTASYNYQEAGEKTLLPNGYWIKSQPYQMMQNVTEAFAVNRYVGIRSNRNDKFLNDGFKQQIIRGSGVVKDFSGELNETYIQNMIDSLKGSGAGGSSYMVLADYQYIGDFQRNVGKGYLVYAGTDNVLGGKEVKGLNVYHYWYNSTHIEMIEEKMFANPQMFSDQNRKAYWICTEDTVLSGGKGRVPFLKSYKYGSMEMFAGEFRGYMDKDGNVSSQGAQERSLDTTFDYVINKYDQLTNAASCGYHYSTN